jgi:hypothetical protein
MGLWFGKAFFLVDLVIFSLAKARRRRGGKFFEGNRGESDGVGFPKWRWVVVRGAVRGVTGRPPLPSGFTLIKFFAFLAVFAPWRDKPVAGYGSTNSNPFQECVGPRCMQVVRKL